jgi:hypothetical protein
MVNRTTGLPMAITTLIEQLQGVDEITHDGALEPGTRVEVRGHFESSWSHG